MKWRLITFFLSSSLIGILFLLSSITLASNNVQITNTPQNEQNPKIAMIDSLIYIVWWYKHEKDSAVYFCQSTNNGKSWGTPFQLWSGANPSISVGDNGYIYIVWESRGEIIFTKSTDGGFSFDDTVRVDNGYCSDIALDDNGHISLIWHKVIYPDGQVNFTKSVDFGATFGKPVALEKRPVHWSLYPSKVAVSPSGNNVYIACISKSYNGNHIRVYFSASLDGGKNFFPWIKTPGPFWHGEYNPGVGSYGENNVYIAWRVDNSHKNHIYLNISEDSGTTWFLGNNGNRIDDGSDKETDAYEPSIIIDKTGVIYVVWASKNDYSNGRFIFIDKSKDGGQSFGFDMLVNDSPNQSNNSYPCIAISNIGSIGIVWQDNRNGNYDIFFASNIFTYGLDISGTTKYYFNDKPVANTTINVAGNQTITNTEGMFSFIGIPEGNYTLIPSKDSDLGNSISAFDASMILRNVVGLLSLTPYQMIASDVSGNGDVSAFDASLILRYVVGLITEFPVGDDWTFVPISFAIDSSNWAIAPDSVRYEPLDSDSLNQDFVGIIYGDVSGNWVGSTDLGAAVITEFIIGNIQHNNDGRWLIPLEMEFSDEAYSGGFKILFNNPDLKFASSSIDNSLTDNMLFTSYASPGCVSFAFASAQPLNEHPVKINVLFEEIKPVTPSASNFEFVDVVVDDKLATVTVVEKQSNKQIPVDWHLSQNYPNPFNAETVIKYQLPEASKVTLTIYNLSGQEVVRLVDEEKDGGFHQVRWNGKDRLGRALASGMYIYRIVTSNYKMGKKLVILK